MIWLLAALGCGGGAASVADIDITPASFDLAECSVCGMIVSEQPAPRGQVLYRDGTRSHTCSLGDLRAQAQVRSPLGEPVGIWVEVLPRDFDPGVASTGALDWERAEKATYVFGAERPLVMGDPILSFRTTADASAAATALGSTPVSWDELSGTPFHRIPDAAHIPAATP